MKIIETDGITYLQELGAGGEWYWGTDSACGDLYEAEEVFLKGNRFEPNRLIFVHYSDGKVYEPIPAKENQYFGRPQYVDGVIYILLVNFAEKQIRVLQYAPGTEALSVKIEIPLAEVKDCYNLMMDDGSTLMLYRQGWENRFQIIWPDRIDFAIGERESFQFCEDGVLVFSEWFEDPEYREEIIVREYATGKILERMPGTAISMRGNQHWILK
jgi:hypothetical protein